MTAAGTPVSIHSERGRRSVNQDAAVVHRLADGRELVAVADGMGGHAAGEVASRKVLEVLCQSLEQGIALEQAVVAANDAIRRDAAENPEWQGMGTTLVALLREGTSYQLVNVGDSRAYRVEPVGMEQITVDHNYWAESIRNGELSAEQAAQSPWRRALTRAIGTDPQVEVDTFGPLSTDPPHAVLLCTDGVHGVVSDNAILDHINASMDTGEAARVLAAAALDAGSDDNITVAVIAFGYPAFGARGEGLDGVPTSAAARAAGDGEDAHPPAISLNGAPREPGASSNRDGSRDHLARGASGGLLLLSGVVLVRAAWQGVRRVRRWFTERDFVDLDG